MLNKQSGSTDATREGTAAGARTGSIRERFLAILNDQRPERIPFIDRMNFWYESHKMAGTLPQRYAGKSLADARDLCGMGQIKFRAPYAHRLKGVTLRRRLNDGETFHEEDPVITFFPGDQ